MTDIAEADDPMGMVNLLADLDSLDEQLILPVNVDLNTLTEDGTYYQRVRWAVGPAYNYPADLNQGTYHVLRVYHYQSDNLIMQELTSYTNKYIRAYDPVALTWTLWESVAYEPPETQFVLTPNVDLDTFTTDGTFYQRLRWSVSTAYHYPEGLNPGTYHILRVYHYKSDNLIVQELTSYTNKYIRAFDDVQGVWSDWSVLKEAPPETQFILTPAVDLDTFTAEGTFYQRERWAAGPDHHYPAGLDASTYHILRVYHYKTDNLIMQELTSYTNKYIRAYDPQKAAWTTWAIMVTEFALPPQTDLNTFINEGTYHQRQRWAVGPAYNYPAGLNQGTYHVLKVYHYLTDNLIMQELTSFSNKYVRAYDPIAETWTIWEAMVKEPPETQFILTPETDLNTFTTENTYYQRQRWAVSTDFNYPAGLDSGTYHVLRVYHYKTDNLIMQELTSYNSKYLRAFDPVENTWTAWSDLNPGTQSILTTETDLNTFTKDGVYYQRARWAVSTAFSYPAGLDAGTYHILRVYHYKTDNLVMQELTSYTSKYVRAYDPNTQLWTAWANLNDRKENVLTQAVDLNTFTTDGTYYQRARWNLDVNYHYPAGLDASAYHILRVWHYGTDNLVMQELTSYTDKYLRAYDPNTTQWTAWSLVSGDVSKIWPYRSMGTRNSVAPVAEGRISTDSYNILKNVLRDVRVLNAVRGNFYRVSYLAVPVIAEGATTVSLALQCEMVPMADFSTTAAGWTIHNQSLQVDVGRGLRTYLVPMVNPSSTRGNNIAFELTIDTDQLARYQNTFMTAWSPEHTLYTYFLDPSAYEYANDLNSYLKMSRQSYGTTPEETYSTRLGIDPIDEITNDLNAGAHLRNGVAGALPAPSAGTIAWVLPNVLETSFDRQVNVLQDYDLFDVPVLHIESGTTEMMIDQTMFLPYLVGEGGWYNWRCQHDAPLHGRMVGTIELLRRVPDATTKVQFQLSIRNNYVIDTANTDRGQLIGIGMASGQQAFELDPAEFNYLPNVDPNNVDESSFVEWGTGLWVRSVIPICSDVVFYPGRVYSIRVRTLYKSGTPLPSLADTRPSDLIVVSGGLSMIYNTRGRTGNIHSAKVGGRI